MPFRRSVTMVALAVGTSVLVAPASFAQSAVAAASAAPSPGAAGAGDPFFPLQGNGGYDVTRYRLRLEWQPGTNVLTGAERVFATATQSLSSFHLDLRESLAVSEVLVDDLPATFTRDGQELIVTPSRPLADGRPFTVSLSYSGVPDVVIDPDGSPEGWVPTSDGAFVVGEPQGSPAWFAVNNTPKDKAFFDVTMTVPEGLTAVGNGKPASRRTAGGKATFQWVEGFPMAPYLATITIGRFQVTQGPTRGQVPTYIAVDPAEAATAAPVVAKIPEMVSFFAGLYGRYPFEIVGAIVDHAPEVGYALETQTKPVFDQAPDESTMAHELAHQWFGDAVTLSAWPDIWLHEGFATYSEWLWDAHAGGVTPQQRFDELMATPADDKMWAPAPNALSQADQLFSAGVYDRGAMTLQVLRDTVGDTAFFAILRTWYTDHRNGTVTTAQFIDVAEQVSGRDLTTLFDTWLRTPGKPVLS